MSTDDPNEYGTEIGDVELELARVCGALQEWRAYLAGPCDDTIAHNDECKPGEMYDGHRHWTDHYEENRGLVVVLNHILAGDYEYCSILRQVGEQ